MLALKTLFSRSNPVAVSDLKNTKMALNKLGYYTIPPHRGIDDWTDDATFSGLESFQRDNGLKVDGLMRPGGPTETSLNRNLMRISSSGGGVGGGNSHYDPNQPRDNIGRWTTVGYGDDGSNIDNVTNRQKTLSRGGSQVSKALGSIRQGWDAVVDKWDYLQETVENARNAPADLLESYRNNPQEMKDVLSDFQTNYRNMSEANVIGGDKYFHCKANCQSSQRGELAERSAAALSDLREVYGFFKGDPRWDSVDDQEANKIGRKAGRAYPDRSCRDLCRPYRPKGLPERY